MNPHICTSILVTSQLATRNQPQLPYLLYLSFYVVLVLLGSGSAILCIRIQTTPTCAKAVYFSRMAMVVFNLSFLNFSREKMDILSDTSCCLAFQIINISYLYMYRVGTYLRYWPLVLYLHTVRDKDCVKQCCGSGRIPDLQYLAGSRCCSFSGSVVLPHLLEVR